jgi:hypothetical protein
MTWEKPVGYAGCYPDLVKVSGNYYIGCYQNNGIQTSPDGHVWKRLANSPQTSGLVVTGMYMYASYQNDTSNKPVYRAPLSDLTSWTNVTTPSMSAGASATGLAYDSIHHVLYVASWAGGLWRVVTQ